MRWKFRKNHQPHIKNAVVGGVEMKVAKELTENGMRALSPYINDSVFYYNRMENGEGRLYAKRSSSNSFSRAVKTLGIVVGLFIASTIMLASTAFAVPAVSVDAFSVTPSTTTGGANIDATVANTYSYTNTTEDLKTTVANFAPGLLGNPPSMPYCSETELLAAACPADSAVGTSIFSAILSDMGGAPLPPLAGTVYNAEIMPGQVGRLGVITPTAGPPLVSEIPFVIRTDGDYGMSGTLTDITRVAFVPPFGVVNIQVVGLSFTLTGSTNGYVRNPTSCAVATSIGTAVGYDDPTVVDAPPSSFTPTGCAGIPFSPSISFSTGGNSSTRRDSHTPLRVAISQGATEADMAGNSFLLPEELNANTAAYDVLCTAAQAAADACPAGSQVGGARATSRFLADPLSGPVFMTEQPGNPLPGLFIPLRGRVPIEINVATELVGNRIKSTVVGLPQLPIATFNLGLDGGPDGVFVNRSSLCFAGESNWRFKSMSADTTAIGHNGAVVTGTPGVEVLGCQPGIATRLTRAQTSKPRLRIKVQRHPSGKKFTRIKVHLPKNMWFDSSKVEGMSGRFASSTEGLKFKVLGRRTVGVTGLPGTSVSKAILVFKNGAVRTNKRVRKSVRRGKTRRLRIKVVTFPTSGKRQISRTTEAAKK